MWIYEMNFKLKVLKKIVTRYYHYSTTCCKQSSIQNSNEIDKKVEDNWKEILHKSMKIFPNFISVEEENDLIYEVDPYMNRLRYEFSHWDNAIHGYRETERGRWNENNIKIIDRIRQKAFPPELSQLGLVHVLDLSAEGWIKPHVDSIRFCGDIIAGLSLLSDSVMRLTMVGFENTCMEDFLLPRRSLYVMSGVARYQYNHEILAAEKSQFRGQAITKTRRISVICRSEATDNKNV